jgi:hypothetical protein
MYSNPLTLCLGAVLVPLLFFDLRLWSLLWSPFCDLFCDLLRWSLLCVLSSLCSLFSSAFLFSAAPEVGCWRPRKKTPCRRVSFPVLALLRFPTICLLRNSKPLSSNAHIRCTVYFGSRCVEKAIYVTIYLYIYIYNRKKINELERIWQEA